MLLLINATENCLLNIFSARILFYQLNYSFSNKNDNQKLKQGGK